MVYNYIYFWQKKYLKNTEVPQAVQPLLNEFSDILVEELPDGLLPISVISETLLNRRIQI